MQTSLLEVYEIFVFEANLGTVVINEGMQHKKIVYFYKIQIYENRI